MSVFSDLEGEIIASFNGKINDEEIIIETESGKRFKMYHEQNCCENVYVKDISGDINSELIGSKIIKAEESSNSEESDYDSKTYTFYRINTEKGLIVIQWLGESNGYYSERVDFAQIIK